MLSYILAVPSCRAPGPVAAMEVVLSSLRTAHILGKQMCPREALHPAIELYRVEVTWRNSR